MKPENIPAASQKAIDKLEELEFEFFPGDRAADAGKPEDAGMPETGGMPEGVGKPEDTGPNLPELTLPEQAAVDFDIPVAVLPDMFDLG